MNRREAIKRTALLLGIAVSPSGVTSVLAQIARDPAAKPLHFKAWQFAAISAVSEVILPRTDTPGAIDAGVPQFIDITYGDFLGEDDQLMINKGINAINTAAKAAHDQPFAKISPAQQETILKAIGEDNKHAQRGFLRKMRELTLLGFFTSEVVAKNESIAIWDPVPGSFIPCQDLSVTNGVAYFE
jgi:gluconate 2-dehydrogenase gamma chain